MAVADLEFQTLPNGDRESTCTMHLLEVISGEEIRKFAVPQGSVWSLAFTPDGRKLASGGGDSTILLWDLTYSKQGGPLQATALTEPALHGLWSDLGGDAAKADRALWALALAPQHSLPFLKKRLQSATPVEVQQVTKLIDKLESKTFAERQAAFLSLDEMGEAAEPILRKTLEGIPPLEVRQYLEQLLKKRDKETIQHLRAIEALEQIGTKEAQQVLEALAKVALKPPVAHAARAALHRLAKRFS